MIRPRKSCENAVKLHFTSRAIALARPSRFGLHPLFPSGSMWELEWTAFSFDLHSVADRLVHLPEVYPAAFGLVRLRRISYSVTRFLQDTHSCLLCDLHRCDGLDLFFCQNGLGFSNERVDLFLCCRCICRYFLMIAECELYAPF